MNRIQAPQKLLIPPRNQGQFQQNGSALLGCISARKRKSTFVTQRKLTPEEMVLQSHNQLIIYIDKLQEKVHKIIETHDSQFLLAYRNHLNRVREQMQELQNKNTKNANSASSHTQRIDNLQKELVIFREQSLKLFQKLTQKDKNIQLLNMKIYELQTQQKFNKKTITDLMKRNKYLEGMLKEFNMKKDSQGNFKYQTIEKNSMSFFEGNSLRKYSSQHRRDQETKNKRLSVYTSGINSQKTSWPTTAALRSKRTSILLNTTNYNPRQALKNYFADHVSKNIKKQ